LLRREKEAMTRSRRPATWLLALNLVLAAALWAMVIALLLWAIRAIQGVP
jgi:hypothetical protein